MRIQSGDRGRVAVSAHTGSAVAGNTHANTYSYPDGHTDSNANGHTRKAYVDTETASQPASSADTVKIIGGANLISDALPWSALVRRAKRNQQCKSVTRSFTAATHALICE